ncbi:DUF6318 family protein [Terracoccus luteus]|uniref:DUF6318 family protein n=1 Tax=Terracoccus luteus TaxID=53356 RepID=UPI0014765663|nr:DUF6318 family protein [Terracoccus luteus]
MRLRQDRGTLPAALRAVALRPPSVQVHDQGKVMSVSRRMTMACAVAATAAVALSACSGSPPEAATSSQQPSSSSTAPPPTTSTSITTTTAAPTTSSAATVDPVIARIPKAARPKTMQGAEAFASFYVEQLNRAFTTAAPEELTGLFSTSCANCETYFQTAQKFERNRWRHSSASLKIASATASKFSTNSAIVNVFLTQRGVKILDSQDRVVDTTSDAEGAFIISLAFREHWEVQRLQTAKK